MRLRELVAKGQIEFVRPTWSLTVDCSEMEIYCVESITSAKTYLNHAFGANVTSLLSSFAWSP